MSWRQIVWRLAYDCEVLVVRLAECLGPADLARVALHLEILVALGAAEPEQLQ